MEKSNKQNNKVTTEAEIWRSRVRQAMLTGRMALNNDTYLRLSMRIVGHLNEALPELSSMTVGFCWPIKNEPDIRPAIVSWLEQGGNAALPVLVRQNQPLLFRRWHPAIKMGVDQYGISFPLEGEWILPSALLIPVVAFDNAGYRLGYGGGYFDRTLADWHPRPLIIGIGYEFNRVSTIYPQVHDQCMDWIITEAGAERTNSSF